MGIFLRAFGLRGDGPSSPDFGIEEWIFYHRDESFEDKKFERTARIWRPEGEGWKQDSLEPDKRTLRRVYFVRFYDEDYKDTEDNTGKTWDFQCWALTSKSSYVRFNGRNLTVDLQMRSFLSGTILERAPEAHLNMVFSPADRYDNGVPLARISHLPSDWPRKEYEFSETEWVDIGKYDRYNTGKVYPYDLLPIKPHSTRDFSIRLDRRRGLVFRRRDEFRAWEQDTDENVTSEQRVVVYRLPAPKGATIRIPFPSKTPAAIGIFEQSLLAPQLTGERENRPLAIPLPPVVEIRAPGFPGLWDTMVADPVAAALRSVRAGGALSLVPHDPCNAGCLLFRLRELGPLSGAAESTGSSIDFVRSHIRFAGFGLDLDPSHQPPSHEVKGQLLEFKSLRNTAGEPLRLPAPVRRRTAIDAGPKETLATPRDKLEQELRLPRNPASDDQEAFVDLELDFGKAPDSDALRIGSLRLEVDPEIEPTLSPGPSPSGEAASGESRPRLRLDMRLDALGPRPVWRLNNRMTLWLSDVDPVGQDLPEGSEYDPPSLGEWLRIDEDSTPNQLAQTFRRGAPLLMPLSEGGKAQMPAVMKVEENASTDTDHWVDVDLVYRGTAKTEGDDKAAPGGAKDGAGDGAHDGGAATPNAGEQAPDGRRWYLVLDREPFSVFAVGVDWSGPSDTAGDARIASWTSRDPEGPRWRLSGESGEIVLLMPPQGIGEGMEKGEHLEKDKLVDYRFAPQAAMRLLADVRGRTPQVPANLRTLLGDPGASVPGALVRGGRFEMLYGLSARVVPDEALWLVESAARRGVPPTLDLTELVRLQHLREDNAEAKAIMDRYVAWTRMYEAWRTRLGLLQLWRPGQDPRTLYLARGVHYYLRMPRDAAQRARDTEGEYADVRIPLRASEPESETEQDALPGGALWGIDSRNIYDSVLRNRDSDEGQLWRPAFTALGGYGAQRAAFDRRRSVVYAETAMGRTHYYSVERIGRIGVLWHRAKHVVIFERQTVRAKQFEEGQRAHEGRPILRKVDEYVEILESERRYPEFGDEPLTRGFVHACQFKHRMIRVDGRWGGDVGRIGWEVPLWNPAVNADVYPKPQVVLEVGTGGGETGLTEILDPENLVFFTSTRASHPRAELPYDDDTDAWLPERGVDFPDRPFPSADAEARGGFDPNDLRRPIAPPAPVSAGYDRFTWRIDPDALAVDVTDGRSDSPTYARFTHVTMSRSRPRREKVELPTDYNGIEKLEKLQEARDKLGGVESQARRLVELMRRDLRAAQARGPLAGRQVKEILGGDATQLIESLNKTLKREDGNEPGKVFDTLKEVLDGDTNLCAVAKRRVEAEIENAEEQVLAEVRDIRDRTLAAVERVPTGRNAAADVRRLKQEVVAEIHRASATLPVAPVPLQRMQQALERFRSEIEALDDAADTKLTEIERAANAAVAAATKTIGKIEAFVVKVKDLGDAGADDLRQKLSQAEKALDDVERNVAGFLGLVDDLHETLHEADAVFDRAAKQVSGISNARLQALARTILNEVRTLRERTESALNDVAENARQVCSAIERMRSAFGAARQAVARGDRDFEDLLTRVNDNARAAQERIQSLHKVVDERISELRTRQREVFENISAGIEAAQGVLDKFPEPATKKAEELGQYVATFTNSIVAVVDEISEVGGAAKAELGSDVEEQFDTVERKITNAAEQAKTSAGDWVGANCEKLIGVVTLESLKTQIESLAANLNDVLESGAGDLHEWLDTRDAEIDAGLSAVEDLLQDAQDTVAETAEDAYAWLEGQGGGLQAVADRTLRLLRGFGAPPMLDQLDFNADAVAYYLQGFGDGLDDMVDVGLSPVTGMLNGVGDHLKALEINWPTVRLGGGDGGLRADDLLPDIDFSEILPSIGAMKLFNQFDGLKAPAGLKDKVKITHDIDKKSRTAWVKAEVDFDLDGAQVLFEYDPIRIEMAGPQDKRGPHFEAFARMQAALSGELEQESRGAIVSDIKLITADLPLAILRDSALRYDHRSGLKVDIDPKRLDLQGALRMISDAMEQFSAEVAGLTVEMAERKGKPIGVRARFDMPLPPLVYGATGISGVVVGVHVALLVQEEFVVEARVYVGLPSAPFTLTIFILGGTGWIDARARYVPASGQVDTRVDVALGASALLGFSFGPLSGVIQIFIAARARLDARTGATDTLSLTLIIGLNGVIVAFGFVSVGLRVLLQVEYRSSGTLIGRGRISVRVRIGRFFKKSFSGTYVKTFSGGGDSSPQVALAGGFTDRTRKYADSLL